MRVKKCVAVVLSLFMMFGGIPVNGQTVSANEPEELETVELTEEIEEDEEDEEISFTGKASARQMLLDMDIVDLKGKKHHISEFSEDYVVLFFGGTSCGGTTYLAKKAASMRDSGKSMKLIIMDVESSGEELDKFGEQYSILVSKNDPYNSDTLIDIYRDYIDEDYGRLVLYTPVVFVFDSDRELISVQMDPSIKEFSPIFASEQDLVPFKYEMTYMQSEARTMLDMVNSFRTGSEAWAWDEQDKNKVKYEGLEKLTYDYGLERVAMKRAAEIAVFYSHMRPSGDSCFTAYDVKGWCGENIAFNQDDANEVFVAWREDNSSYLGQGHRRNMLDPDYKYFGVAGVTINEYTYWVQEFNSVPTNTSYCEPVDTETLVEVLVDKGFISKRSLDIISDFRVKLDVGEVISLPEVQELVAFDESLPMAGQPIYGVTAQWGDYDDSIIKVDTKNNTIQALKPGETYLYATADGASDYMLVEVNAVPIKGITFENDTATIPRNYEKKFKLLPVPGNASEKISNVTYSSSDETVVTVEGNGDTVKVVSQDKEGSAVITARMGNYTAYMRINVAALVKFKEEKVELIAKAGTTRNLEISLDDSYKESELKWSSSDTSLVKVDKGVITILKSLDEKKEVDITVSTKDKLFKDTCKVTLLPWSRAKAPKANIPSGDVEEGTTVLFAVNDPDTKIYYTIDYNAKDGIDEPSFDKNGDPGPGTSLYEEAVTVDKSMYITLISRKEGLQDSKPVTYKYNVTYDWGDVDSKKLQALFGQPQMVPKGLWYTFGSDSKGYTEVYTESAATDLHFGYTGAAIVFNEDILVFHGNRRLWENRDYVVSYANNKNCGPADDSKAPTVIISGKGSYGKAATFKYSIDKADLAGAEISSEKSIAVLEGTKLSTIKPQIIFEGRQLSSKKDVKVVFYKDSVSEENMVTDPSKQAVRSGEEYVAVAEACEDGNYTGRVKDTVSITVISKSDKAFASLSKAKITIPKVAYDKDGVDVSQLFSEGKAVVKSGKNTLAYGQDYIVLSDKLYDAGKHSIIIQGTGKATEGNTCYVGEKKATLEITGIKALKVKVACLNKTPEYSGKKLTLSDLYKEDKTGFEKVTLYTSYDGEMLVLSEGEDYDVTMDNSGSTGKLNVKFRLKGRFSGSIVKTVDVKAANLANAVVTAEDTRYSKAGATTKITVKYGDMTLREGIDYLVSYKNNKKVASKDEANAPTAVIKGTGNFTGTGSTTFSVEKAIFEDSVTLTAQDKFFNPKAKKGYYLSAPQLENGGQPVTLEKSDLHYYDVATGKELTAEDEFTVGMAVEIRLTVTCSPDSSYEAGTYELKNYYRILDSGMDIQKATVKVNNPAALVFNNGKAVVPIKSEDLTVKLGKTVLSSSDYDIVSVTGNRFLGTAKVKLRGKGSYGGTKSFTFKVYSRTLK